MTPCLLPMGCNALRSVLYDSVGSSVVIKEMHAAAAAAQVQVWFPSHNITIINCFTKTFRSSTVALRARSSLRLNPCRANHRVNGIDHSSLC